MGLESAAAGSFRCSIAPWLSVRNGAKAVEFYEAAFGAKEVYPLDAGGGVVARLSVDGAEFWVSEESPEHDNASPAPAGGVAVRMILTVADPDAVFARALRAGASQVYPVSEGYGWRLGRVVDPFGHHWRLGGRLVVRDSSAACRRRPRPQPLQTTQSARHSR